MPGMLQFIENQFGISRDSDRLGPSNAIWDDGEWIPYPTEDKSLRPETQIKVEAHAKKKNEGQTMKNSKLCILVDYENTQKVQTDGLDMETTSIKFFIGKSQNSLPFELVERFQKFGDGVEWIKSSGNGDNALDFHIAYTLGVMTTTNKEIEYIILSGDKGFDPLVSYLNAKGIKCKRVKSLDGSAAPNQPAPAKPKTPASKPAASKPAATKSTTPKPAVPKPEVDQTKRVIEVIMKMKSPSHPKTVKKLKNTIKTHLGTKATAEDADAVFNEMVKNKLIEVDQTKVTYNNK